MHDAGADEPFGNLVITITTAFWVQGVQPFGGHNHDLAVLVCLDDVDEGAVTFGLEVRILGGAAGGHPRDKLALWEGGTEATEHFGIHRVIKVKDIPRVGVEHRH